MDMTFSMTPLIGGMHVESRPACTLCGNDGLILYETLIDHQYGVPGTWSLRKCGNKRCNMVWQDPMITAEDLPLAYRTYYTHAGHDVFGTMNAWRRTFSLLDRLMARLHGLNAERQRFRLGYLDDRLPGSLLDIGCGNGDFAALMRQRGWSVRGTDADADAARDVVTNHGFEVDVGELNELAYPAGTFNAVTARHVLEHVRDPERFVLECWRILKPGGRLVLVTPNVASLGHQLYREHWQGLEPPRHLFLYDPHTLHQLAVASGIETARIFSTAQGASYIFRSSERIRTGRYDAAKSWPRTLIQYWLWQFQEIRSLRNGSSECGEELILLADKPALPATHAAGNRIFVPGKPETQSRRRMPACSM